MFFWTSLAAAGVRIAFTSRAAGNLATHVGDDPERSARNRSVLESGMGIAPGSLRFMNQTHSTIVAQVVCGVPDADALVSPAGSEALAVLVADCVPVVLVGVDSHGAASTAVVHAGRKGVEGNIAGRAVSSLRESGAETVNAWIGPSVCGACYEVPAELRARVAGAVPSTFSTTSWGTPALDLPTGVRTQLGAAGALVQELGPAPSHLCSLENDELFSHRAVGRGRPVGRMAGLVWQA
ncbi:hypothetical protein BJ994_001166 [Arthrobacter pigmenti]|uniref:Purine nucleoside phosphorylase n=1 Tax=Arthrobacter pigmenti TaxID=271432 RepID=A0A846RK96_9MICC|nr:hypothetical protein [Arthrobacter pigmenti]